MFPRDQLFSDRGKLRFNKLYFVGYIMQTIYVFVYKKIIKRKLCLDRVNIRSTKYLYWSRKSWRFSNPIRICSKDSLRFLFDSNDTKHFLFDTKQFLFNTKDSLCFLRDSKDHSLKENPNYFRSEEKRQTRRTINNS